MTKAEADSIIRDLLLRVHEILMEFDPKDKTSINMSVSEDCVWAWQYKPGEENKIEVFEVFK